MNQAQCKMKFDTKDFYLVATERGLSSVSTSSNKELPVLNKITGSSAAEKILKKAAQELTEYFSGNRQEFTVPLDAQGTPFQKKVWNALSQIPYGKTVSYRDIAKKIKSDKAFRAVGSANGKNPLCIIVPCHRVIAADGTLGGYSAGLELKKKLLKLENVAL